MDHHSHIAAPPIDPSAPAPGSEQSGLDEVVEPVAVRKSRACRRYLDALSSQALYSPDQVARARALVEVEDARAAYRQLGGRAGSRWSQDYQHYYDAARELVESSLPA